MKTNLIRVALRYRAVFLDINREDIDMTSKATAPVMAFVARLKENGFCVSEEVLHALNAVSVDTLAEITKTVNDVMGVDLNWAPLVKGWDVPTGESQGDHLITWITNIFGGEKAGFKGTTLQCGHFIPNGSFPLERYNGCPFCGAPFVTTDLVYKGQTSKLKELRLFTNKELREVFDSLLFSSTPLDGSEMNSLDILIGHYPLPTNLEIRIKETAMLVVKSLVAQDRSEEASKLLMTPTDILRYLWYEKTSYAQIIEPRTLIANARSLYHHIWGPLDKGKDAARDMKLKLRLKYDRKACLRVAKWLNALPMTAVLAAENMNPKRGMWVRMIRALRLGEYSRKAGMEHLAEILDVFYNKTYFTWRGRVDCARKHNDAYKTLELLKERPGLFARCLFATMLRFGSEKTLAAFNEISDKLPARLLTSLGNAAETYFDTEQHRIVHPITGVTQRVEANKLLLLYDKEAREQMVKDVLSLYNASMERRFAAQKTEAKTMYIDPSLYNIPLSVGDRTLSIKDSSCALMGTRFPIEGNSVRLFLQWGKGLHAQDLDMDLSCYISLQKGKFNYCCYWNLDCIGAKHSGDIREIPEMVGTAEYIELYMPELEAAGAQYVTFTCNAYSCGSLSPNLVVGWMDSANKMEVSKETGVAYDPSCVQHMIRIGEDNLSKGLVFGVLDVAKREIIWLEMAYKSQTIADADNKSIEALLHRLEEKMSIGELLEIKAKAQNLSVVESADDADEVYTYEWALNPADVSKLLYL